jgi:hypothetical protein
MGGKATPAAGFALYMDQLMKLLEPDHWRNWLQIKS